MYLVIDTKSRNVLGDFEIEEDAYQFVGDLVIVDPTVAKDIRVVATSEGRGLYEAVARDRSGEAEGREEA